MTSAWIVWNDSVALCLKHTSQYAVVIDDESHVPVELEPLPFTDAPEGYWAETAV